MGLCQTSNRGHVDFTKDIARIKVTNPNGQQVDGLTMARDCTIKSRSMYQKDHKGSGVDYGTWEEWSRAVRAAIREGKPMPRVPVSQGALWAEEIQGETGVGIALETMDWLHAMLFAGHIQPGMGLLWTPSVMQLGEVAQGVAEVAGDAGLHFGAKSPKWDPRHLPLAENIVTPSSNETTQLGLASYGLLGAVNPSRAIYPIERGSDTTDNKTEDGTPDWRNRPDHQRARITKKIIREFLAKNGLDTKVVMTYDASHTNGPDRVHMIADDVEGAVQEKDLDGNDLYEAVMVEVAPEGNLALSDTKQAVVGGERVQDIVDRISRHRPIFDRRNLSNQ